MGFSFLSPCCHAFIWLPSPHAGRWHSFTASLCISSPAKERTGGGDGSGGVVPLQLAAARDRGGMVAEPELHLQHLALTTIPVSLLHWGTGGGLASLCSSLSFQAKRKRNKLCLSLYCWGVRRSQEKSSMMQISILLVSLSL